MLIVYNKALDISTKDVLSCKDRVQLKSWKADMEIHIAEVEAQLSKARATRISSGEYSDPEWYSRTTAYKRLQSGLKAQIDAQLSALKQEEITKNDYVEKIFWKNRLKEIVGSEAIADYYEELNELLRRKSKEQ